MKIGITKMKGVVKLNENTLKLSTKSVKNEANTWGQFTDRCFALFSVKFLHDGLNSHLIEIKATGHIKIYLKIIFSGNFQSQFY